MARNVLASMLDELMGKHRNALPSEIPVDVGFEDPEVCKYFLAGYCHHEMFNNTKADLGHCGKTHDEKLREEYRASEKFQKLGYEDEWLVALQRVQNDMQRKIIRNKQRLTLTQGGGKSDDGSNEKAEAKIDSLSEKIEALLKQAETLGAQGRVEEAQKLIEQTEQLKEERDECRKTVESSIAELKAMEVCDICGCFLVIGDSQHRLDEHLSGKQHLGFAKIKATIEELLRRKEERRRQRQEQFKNEMETREKQRGGFEGSNRSRHSRNRSRSTSPGRDVERFSGRRSPRRFDQQRYHHRDDDRRRYRPAHVNNDAGHHYDRDRRHSSSRYPDYGRHQASYRSRSPRHHGSKSPRADDGYRRSEDSERRSAVTSRSSDRETSSSAVAPGYKVNSPSPKKLTPTASVSGPSAPDDDEDEEGLISDD